MINEYEIIREAGAYSHPGIYMSGANWMQEQWIAKVKGMIERYQHQLNIRIALWNEIVNDKEIDLQQLGYRLCYSAHQKEALTKLLEK